MTRAASAPAAELWVRCVRCGTITYRRRFERALGVCPDCGWHAPLTSAERLRQLLDPGSHRPLPPSCCADDPLGFVDTTPYPRRLAAARTRTGQPAGVLSAWGTIGGHRLVVAVMDFRFLGGSLGCAEGEAVTAAAEWALRERLPLLTVTASGGARMQEGALALMQMAKTSQALGELDAQGLLTVSLVTDPTYGGVAASFATLADVVVAEPGARLGFAGPRVIEQTIRRPLPEGFQAAEVLLRQGLVDDVQPRARLRSVLTRLLAAQAAPPPLPAVTDPTVTSPGDAVPVPAWEAVRLARHPGRPTTLDYLAEAFDGFLELHGDRLGGECAAVVGGIAELAGRSVVVVGHQKGHDARELAARNFGMATPAGHRKAARLMRLAAKLGLPVVTLVDTPGAYPGREAEEHGQAQAIAENLRLMARLPVPVVAVVTGEGGSGGALALAVADRVLALSHAVYSVISPEGCAAIVWKDSAAAPSAARALRLDTAELLRLGVVDAVVPEPAGGAHTDPGRSAHLLRDALLAVLPDLLRQPPAALVRARRRRFRAFGAALVDDRAAGEDTGPPAVEAVVR